jgi:hypothetical protein
MSRRPGPLTLRAKNPTDLLAMVPCILGFHPADSIVLVTLGGDGGFHARVDLPPVGADVPAAVAAVLQVARRERIGRSVLVVYTADAALAAAAEREVRAGLEAFGAQLVEAIRADGARWFSLSGCTGPCCPPEGTPYDISDHPFLVQSVFAGRVTLPSRAALAASLDGDGPGRAAVQRAVDAAVWVTADAADGRRPTGPGRPAASTREQARRRLVQEGRWVEQRLRAFLADRAPLSDDDVARLLVALTSIDVRDVAWAQMDRANAEEHVELWRDVVRRSPDGLVAAPAALLGFAAWLAGDGALAWCAVDRAQRAEPGYGLAGLLAQALAGGVPPSAWVPLGPEALTLFAG